MRAISRAPLQAVFRPLDAPDTAYTAYDNEGQTLQQASSGNEDGVVDYPDHLGVGQQPGLLAGVAISDVGGGSSGSPRPPSPTTTRTRRSPTR